jgi:hypothetical protein
VQIKPGGRGDRNDNLICSLEKGYGMLLYIKKAPLSQEGFCKSNLYLLYSRGKKVLMRSFYGPTDKKMFYLFYYHLFGITLFTSPYK